MTATNKKVERIQSGVRIEKNVLKVLKAIAARNEVGLGDLIEGIVLHSFEGRRHLARIRWASSNKYAWHTDLI
jgi:hypothetical protein